MRAPTARRRTSSGRRGPARQRRRIHGPAKPALPARCDDRGPVNRCPPTGLDDCLRGPVVVQADAARNPDSSSAASTALPPSAACPASRHTPAPRRHRRPRGSRPAASTVSDGHPGKSIAIRTPAREPGDARWSMSLLSTPASAASAAASRAPAHARVPDHDERAAQ